MRVEGRRYDHGQPVSIEFEDGRIANIGPFQTGGKGKLPLLAPGLVDLQVNGYGGLEFTSSGLTEEAVEQISLAMTPLGVTRYLPTVITQEHDLLRHALGTIADAMQTRPAVASSVIGIHLEGPYISAEEGPRGAHAVKHCRPPDWQEFERLQEAARGQIKLITLSPEYPSAAEFARRAVASGVLVSIGHTNANSQQIAAVVDAGARLSTHLGNGAHARIQRHPNYIWDQLSHDQLTASLIVDGFHLPPSVVKAMVRAKTPDRVVLISDMTGLAGSVPAQPGRYEHPGLGAVEVLPDGRVVVAGQQDYLAGATRPLSTGITRVMEYAGVDLEIAVNMASLHPARLLQLDDRALERGAVADLIEFTLTDQGAFEVLATFRAGECVWRKE